MFIEGIAPVLLKLAPVVLTLGGLGAAIRETLLKYRARSDLSKAIQSNKQDVDEVSRLLKKNDLEAAANVVRKYTTGLPPGEKNEAESALAQRSASGRAGYIRDVSNSS